MFVIGTGSGLGNGVAEKFASCGFKVVLFSRSQSHLDEYAADFVQKGFDIGLQVADVTDFTSFAKSFQNAININGFPDVLFYNVGITAPDNKETMNPQVLMEHYAADVAGAYNVVRLVDTEDFAAKKGAILITGGGLALQPHIDYLPLSMDKAALRAMVQALVPVFKKKNIYIGTVQVTGRIGSNEYFSPANIAEKFWELYETRETNEVIY